MAEDLVDEIARALREGKLPNAQAWEVAAAVQSLLAEQGGPALTLPQARLAMEVLNKHRHFDQTARLATAWAKEGLPADVTINKHHSQAAINLGALDEGTSAARRRSAARGCIHPERRQRATGIPWPPGSAREAALRRVEGSR